MNEFENALIKTLTHIGDGLHKVAKSIDNAPTIDQELGEAGTAIERGLSEVATAIDNMEVNR